MGRNIILTDQGTLVFSEAKANGTDGVTVQAPASLAAAYTLTLPTTDGNANEFLQTDGAGALSWGTSTATLDSAYTNGNKIDADGTEVEIEVAAASGNVALLLDQDDDQHALSITKDGTGAGAGINVTNAGTGQGALITQNGVGIGLQVTQNAAAAVLQLNQTQNAQGIDLNKTGVGAGVVLDIDNDGTGIGARVTQDGVAVACFIDQNANETALDIDSEATGFPLINLAPVTGNTRGDIALSTARTAAPASPSEGDIWYDGTLDRFQIQMAAEQTIKSTYVASAGAGDKQTISSGAITIGAGWTTVEIEGGGVGDDTLVTINSSPQAQTGDIIVITPDAAGDVITVSSGTGNIELAGGYDVLLFGGVYRTLTLIYTGTDWIEIADTSNQPTVLRLNQPFQDVTATTTTTILFTAGNHIDLAMDASITTLNFTAPRDGEHYFFRIQQDATGSRTIAWPAAVKWKGGTAPTLSTAASAIDAVSMVYNATNTEYLADYGLNFS